MESVPRDGGNFQALRGRGVLRRDGQGFGGTPLAHLGTPEQKDRFLPRIARGELKWSLAMTEPAGGTDILGAIRTTAVRKGDRYVVNGSKQWISGAHKADYLTAIVITDPAAPRKKGLSALIIDAKSPGVTIKPIPKLGIHGCGTNAIFFDDVEVPVENLLGTENNGWYELLHTLNPERISTSVFSLGIAQAAFDYALAYAKERQAFGKPIGGFQILQHYLADIAIEIELARNLVYKCAWLRTTAALTMLRSPWPRSPPAALPSSLRATAWRSSAATASRWNTTCSGTSATTSR